MSEEALASGRTTRRAFLGMGSNMGDRLELLKTAVSALDDLHRVSSLYETEPVGGPDQDPFLNLVVELATERSPRELLEVCRELETAAERVRTVRWGPRTLDVDVLWVEGESVDEPDLVVPHPRMRIRRFVMQPLAELAPDVAGDDWERHLEDDDAEVIVLGPLQPDPAIEADASTSGQSR